MKKIIPKKKLGQHFLTDLNIAEKISNTLNFEDYDEVLEVGPGMGVLTSFILKKTTPYVIDIDSESIKYLNENFIELKDKIIEEDFLSFDLNSIFNKPFAVIGNFPYNISSQIVFKVIRYREMIPFFSGMFQKEVAQRICEPSGSKKYGILSVFCQLFFAGLPMILVIYGLILIILVSVIAYFSLDHVQNRIDSFLGNADTYQIDLSIMAFKSGGIFGKGPGQGDLKEKIPDASTDFIFAVAGEELGLIFCIIILIIILSIVIKTLLKVLKINNPYKIVAISGLICSFGLQSLINILSALGVIPTKGMTLPFVSYGGSSMLATSILFGFLLSLTNINNNEE